MSELVCDAIPAPGVSRAGGRGESEGIPFVSELVHDVCAARTDELLSTLKPELRRVVVLVMTSLAPTMRDQAIQLAELIVSSPDPTRSAALFEKIFAAERDRFVKLLTDELDTKREK